MLGQNCVKSLRITKVANRMKCEETRGRLGTKYCFQTLFEKFSFHFYVFINNSSVLKKKSFLGLNLLHLAKESHRANVKEF